MALLEDGWSGNVVTVVAVGAAVLVLPVLVPGLAPPLRTALKAGVGLFLESEFEAEGGLIDKLVGDTIEALLSGASQARTEADRERLARRAAGRFEQRARARAEHWGRDDSGKKRRYGRHVAHLKRAVAAAERNRPAAERELLADAVAGVPEDW